MASNNRTVSTLPFPKVLSWAPLIVIALIAVFGSTFATSSRAAADSAPSCWVELYPRPHEKLRQSGKTPEWEPRAELDRYAVLVNPSVPDYRSGWTADMNLAYQFMASCADSKEAIDVLFDEAARKTFAELGLSLSVGLPTLRDIRTTTFVLERPKYWLRDCIVAIKFMPAVKRSATFENWKYWPMKSFMLEFTNKHSDAFAFNTPEIDYKHSRIYFEFWRSCDRRIEMAQNLIDAYKKKFKDGRHYRVLKHKYWSYPLNSYSGGPMWLDHYFPNDPRAYK